MLAQTVLQPQAPNKLLSKPGVWHPFRCVCIAMAFKADVGLYHGSYEPRFHICLALGGIYWVQTLILRTRLIQQKRAKFWMNISPVCFFSDLAPSCLHFNRKVWMQTAIRPQVAGHWDSSISIHHGSPLSSPGTQTSSAHLMNPTIYLQVLKISLSVISQTGIPKRCQSKSYHYVECFFFCSDYKQRGQENAPNFKPTWN